jgi:hypothetical protein
MNYTVASHSGGLQAIPEEYINDVYAAISNVKCKVVRGAVKHIRQEILTELMHKGWSSEVPIAANSEMTITSIRSSIGLCLQTGNIARIYADLLKCTLSFLS